MSLLARLREGRNQRFLDRRAAIQQQDADIAQSLAQDAYGMLLGTPQGPLSAENGGMTASLPFAQQDPSAQARTLGALSQAGAAGQSTVASLLAARMPTTPAQNAAMEAERQKQITSIERALRDDFMNNQTVTDFNDMVGSHAQLMAALDTGSALGAQAAVIKMAKILDPGSVVRTEEGVAVRSSIGIIDQMWNAVKQAQGEGFNAETDAQFRQLGDMLLASQMQGYQRLVDQFIGATLRNGANPDNVIFGITNQGVQNLMKQMGLVSPQERNSGEAPLLVID